MKIVLASILMVSVLILGVSEIHADVNVSVPVGTSVPGCESTNECYIPYEVTINAGETVTWTNEDTAAHTVTSGSPADGPDGKFDSSLFMAGSSYSQKFDSAGSYHYFCMVHPWMEGNVVVLVSTSNKQPTHQPSTQNTNTNQITTLEKENLKLRQEITDLKMENRDLKNQITTLEKEVDSLKDKIIEMSTEFMNSVKQLNNWFRSQLG